jgi:hypothetical protein
MNQAKKMTTGPVDIQSKFVNALRTQGKAEFPISGALPCPYPGHHGRMFQNIEQLYDHATDEHSKEIKNIEPEQVKETLKKAALKLR